MVRFVRQIFRIFSSLRFAVVIITGIAVSLAIGTFLESFYDTRTANYYVYKSLGFQGLLFGLGVTIFCVAMSRYPWRKSHTPFLLAHLGILILLAGSWVTQRHGLDGSMQITESESRSTVDFESEVLAISDDSKVRLF